MPWQRQRQRRRCDHENYNRLTPKKGNSAALSFRFYHDSVGNHEGGDESRDFANGAAAGYGGAIACFSSEVSSLRRRGLRTPRLLRPPLPRVSRRRPRSSRSQTRGAVVPCVKMGGSVGQGTLLDTRGRFIDNVDNDYALDPMESSRHDGKSDNQLNSLHLPNNLRSPSPGPRPRPAPPGHDPEDPRAQRVGLVQHLRRGPLPLVQHLVRACRSRSSSSTA